MAANRCGPSSSGWSDVTDLFGPLSFVTPAKRTVLRDALGITNVFGLVHHFPRRYISNNELSDLADLRLGDHVTVLAEVRSVSHRRTKAGDSEVITVSITDGSSRLSVVFFRKGRRTRMRLPKEGERALFAGKVSEFQGSLQLAHPHFIPLRPDVDAEEDERFVAFTAPIRPIYPATAAITSERLREYITAALERLGPLPDPVPAEVRLRQGLIAWDDAIRIAHLPPTMDALESARRRLRFDEAFVPQVALAQRRYALRGAAARPRPARRDGLVEALDARLPYRLTDAQVRVGRLLESEMADVHPMHRLLQGDVGSGKTVVALRAMLGAVDAGGQAALLAPTEVLAHQHWRSITGLLGPIGERGRLRFDDDGSPEGTSVALLTGSLNAAARRTALLDIASGQAGIVIGTHALLEDRVTFADLALVVIDEQHRFGVEQRAALADKAADGTRPHVLVMTATPIPRTVAMTVFGDLDTTALDQMPAGRQPITTHVVPMRDKPHFLDRVWARVREEVAAGRRAYVVCPRIDGSDAADSGGYAVLDLAESLRAGPLAGLRVGILHGRMSSDDKEAAMAAFAVDGPDALDVLVCTTVVEVGLDVARASTMVVMDAERFGVSQLHQLRGRVGRGSDPGLCLLVTGSAADSASRARLDGVAATTDGFALARLDLEQRREGDVLGRMQSGESGFTFLDLLRHEDVIEAAHDEATALVEADPTLARNRALAAMLAEIESRSDYLMKD